MSKQVTKRAGETLHTNLWISSLNEFKSLRVVIFCGMMCAFAIILNYVTTIRIGDFIKIGFSGIPNQAVSYLFGPAIGGIFGGALDILKFMLHPDGTYFPGFTISAILGGLFFGMILYHRPVSVWRILLAQFLVKLFVNIGCNTLWLNLLYKKAVLLILPERIISNLIMLPIDTLICYIVLKAVDRSVRPMFQEQNQNKISQ